MRNSNALIIGLFASAILFSCGQANSDANNEAETENTEESSNAEMIEKEDSSDEAEEAPQTVEERIQEIKELYAKIQSSPNQNKDCISESKTTINYDVIKEGIPFENTAKKCSLEDGLAYEQVTMNGYEWSETTHFYHKDEQRFFVFVTGGAEAYGYEYRIYYDKNYKDIRILVAENDYDGEEVSAPFVLKDENRREEILSGVDYAKNELKTILESK